jgi:hypothetical protein
MLNNQLLRNAVDAWRKRDNKVAAAAASGAGREVVESIRHGRPMDHAWISSDGDLLYF